MPHRASRRVTIAAMLEATFDALYRLRDEDLVASAHTRGPWDAAAQHGGAPAALVVQLVTQAEDAPDFRFARLVMELLRPVPVGALTAAVEPAPSGRNVHRHAVVLRAAGKEVVRAQVSFARARHGPLAPEDSIDEPGMPPRGRDRPLVIPGMASDGPSFLTTAMDTDMADAGAGRAGPAAVWFRLRVPVLSGMPTSAAARAVAAADFGNGISWVLPFADYTFLNYDLTVQLHRLPRGPWIGVRAQTRLGPDGAGLCTSRLYDEEGPLGFAQQGLLIQPRAT